MRDTISLGRVAGVPVGLNWSLLVIVGLFAFALADNRFPYDAPGYTGALYALAGALSAVALLFSVLLHELGHAVVARRLGLAVEGITLTWMGGLTRIEGESTSPAREVSVAAVGPGVSVLVGGVLWGVAVLSSTAGAGTLVTSALRWLAVVNVALAAFNLIPAAPLDGGRVLHAAVWAVGRSRWAATRAASGAGILLAGAVLAFGVWEVISRGDTVNGVLVVVLGWWLLSAARQEQQLGVVHHLLEGVPVHDVMRPVAAAPGWVDRREFVERYARPYPGRVWLLERWGGGYSGVVSGDSVLVDTPVAGRADELGVPIDAAAGTLPGEELLTALERTNGAKVLLVIEDEHTVGAVLPGDVDDILRSKRRPGPAAGGAVSGRLT